MKRQITQSFYERGCLKANKHLKRFLTPFVLRERKLKSQINPVPYPLRG